MAAKGIGAGLALAVIVALLALLAWGIRSKAPVTGMSGITRVHKPAPDFRMPLFDGGEIALSEHIGRPIVINFWASWCPPCLEEALDLEKLWRTYREQDVLLIGVNIQDTEEDARAFLRWFNISYPNGRDEDGHITVDYGVIGLPVTFFIDREGIVQHRWVGAIGEDDVVAWVNHLVAGAPFPGDGEKENIKGFIELEGER